MPGKGTARQLKDDTLERAPQSGLTSASTRQSSGTVVQRGRRKSSTSTSYVTAQENEGIPGKKDRERKKSKQSIYPLGSDENVPGKPGPDSNITRCLPYKINDLTASLATRDVDMINARGCGAPLKLQLSKPLQSSTVRDVTVLMNEKGYWLLKS